MSDKTTIFTCFLEYLWNHCLEVECISTHYSPKKWENHRFLNKIWSLTSGVRASRSGLAPVRAWNFPRMGMAQPLEWPALLPYCPLGERVSYIQPEPLLLQLVFIASFPPTRDCCEHTISSMTPHRCWGAVRCQEAVPSAGFPLFSHNMQCRATFCHRLEKDVSQCPHHIFSCFQFILGLLRLQVPNTMKDFTLTLNVIKTKKSWNKCHK